MKNSLDYNLINGLVKTAIQAALKSGEYLMKHSGVDTQINNSEGKDIKLKSDLESEKIIFTSLMETGIDILSEEAGYIKLNDQDDEILWIVDPLDGSLNYSREIPIYCISIGLWVGNKPVFGVIYDYVHDLLYKGIVGKGAFLNETPIKVSEINSQDNSILATGFPVYSSFDDLTLMNQIRNFQNYKKVRLFGSAAFSMMMVARGSVEVYKENNIAWWDVAAGIAIVIAAGGEVNFEFTNHEKSLLNVLATNSNLVLDDN